MNLPIFLMNYNLSIHHNYDELTSFLIKILMNKFFLKSDLLILEFTLK